MAISKENKINEEIRDKELRVIDESGEMIGIMSRDKALALAEEKKAGSGEYLAERQTAGLQDSGLRKIQIRNSEERGKAKRKNRNGSGKGDQTEHLYRGPRYQVKAKTACKFLKEGDKVKVSLRFRGRERDHTAKGPRGHGKICRMLQRGGVMDKNLLLRAEV